MFNLDKYVEKMMDVKLIDPNDRQLQARAVLDQKKVKRRVEELKSDGQFSAVIVYKYNDPSRLRGIIDGAHNYAAAALLGWTEVRVREIPETDMDPLTAQLLSLRLNTENASLNKKDIIFFCKSRSDKGKTLEEIGKEIGKSKSMVQKYIAAAESDDAQAVADGTKSIAEAIGKKKADKKMNYKPRGNNGFKCNMDYNPKKDDPVAAKEFLDKTVPSLYKQIEDGAKNYAAPGDVKKDKAAEREAINAAKQEFRAKKTKLKQINDAVKSGEKSVKDSEKTGIDSSALKQHLEGLKKQQETLKAEVRELKKTVRSTGYGVRRKTKQSTDNKDGVVQPCTQHTVLRTDVEGTDQAAEAEKEKAKLKSQAQPIIDDLKRKRQALIDKSDKDMENQIAESGQSREELIKMIDERLEQIKKKLGE